MAKLAFYVFIVFTLVNCSNKGEEIPKKPRELAEESLRAKRDLYLKLVKDVQDEHGFIDSNECDSLLWTSLGQYSGVSDINLLAARDEKTKQWFRTPAKTCFDRGERGETGHGTSKSDISKDMFTGLFWTAKDNLGRDEILDIWKYGKAHNWVMGRGPLARTWLSVNLQNTLAILADKPKSVLPEFWKFSDSSYSDVHISVLHIMLRAHLENEISGEMFRYLEKAFLRWPDNAFFRLSYSFFIEKIDLSQVYEALMDEKLFPSDHLPTTDQRCSNYIWSHGEQADYEPCDPYHVWAGIDYLFMTKLMGL